MMILLGFISLCLSGSSLPIPPQSVPEGQRIKLLPFRYEDVVLKGGPMGVQASAARDYFLGLNEDSLLQGFRLRAGMAAPGKPMGGWYDPDGFAGAHPFGQYVSALSRMYANTGDVRFKRKVDRLVAGFHATLRADGFFYSSDKVAREWPCYLYDKNCIGMRDAYNLTGNAEALTVLRRMTDWAVDHLPRRSDEWYTLPENLYKCFELTKEPRYLKMAREFDFSLGYYDDFASGKSAFTPDRHAYSHVNSLNSAAKTFEFTGSRKYLDATKNAWTFLTTTQMYASGGWGPDEHFVVAGEGQLAKSLKTTEKGFETPCGAYANVNLDRYLLRFTGDSKYGDNMERVLLNGMLAALPPQKDGHSFYYSDYQDGGRKAYFPDVWPCCSGTYAEITADYPLDIYFYDDKAVYVNLFAPSKVRWARQTGEITIEQQTTFPLNAATQFTFHAAKPSRFRFRIRVPRWVTSNPIVLINRRPVPINFGIRGFLSIDRHWREGDTVEVTFPVSPRFEPIDSRTPSRVALMVGPLLYVAIANGEVSLSDDLERPQDWLKRDKVSLADLTTPSGQVFRPIYLVGDERYTTYCTVHR